MADAGRADEADEAYRGEVLELFRAQHGSFVTQFTIFAIFCLSFLALIVVPIVALKLESGRLQAELAAKEQALAEQQQRYDDEKAQQAALEAERASAAAELAALREQQQQKAAEADSAAARLSTLQVDLDKIDRQKAGVDKRLSVLTASTSGIAEVVGSFDADARTNDLRLWFQDMANARYDAPDPACPADQANPSPYLSCMVRNKLHADWDADMGHIRQTVDVLRDTEPETAAAIDRAVADVRAEFEAALDAHPDFWHTIDEKQDFMGVIQEKLRHAFSGIDLAIKERIATVEQEVIDLTAQASDLTDQQQQAQEAQAAVQAEQAAIATELASLTERSNDLDQRKTVLDRQVATTATEVARLQGELTAASAQLEQRRSVIDGMREAIEQRLEGFESPFGKLPLGLKEAALAFPFILAAGFLICTLLLARLLRLRGEYHGLSLRNAPAEEAGHRVGLLAPLWLDPLRSSLMNGLIAVLLLLPVPIFAVTVSLAIAGVLLPVEGEPSDAYLIPFYRVLYAAGSVLMAVGIWHVMTEWRHYRRRLYELAG